MCSCIFCYVHSTPLGPTGPLLRTIRSNHDGVLSLGVLYENHQTQSSARTRADGVFLFLHDKPGMACSRRFALRGNLCLGLHKSLGGFPGTISFEIL